MRLEYHEPNYVLIDAEKDHALMGGGWKWSRTSGVYFTDNPFEALRFYPMAQVDDATSKRLCDLALAVLMSEAHTTAFSPAVPEDMALMDFQRAGVEYALDRPHALIGDQPGLGKTAQATVIGNEIDAQRTLIVCPASVRLHWANEIRAWSTLERPTPYVVQKAADGLHPRASHVVISYDLCRNPVFLKILARDHWDHLIIDEAHYLKTPEAQRTRALFGNLSDSEAPYISASAERITALTGTPLPNRPRECYTLARSLCWESIDWLSQNAFMSRYNPGVGREEKAFRLDDLRMRLRAHFMVRRRKSEVLEQLPDKTYHIEAVTATGEAAKVVKAEHDLVGNPETYQDLMRVLRERKLDPGHISTLRYELGVATAPLFARLIRDRLEGGVDKIGVFAHHKDVVNILVEALQGYNPRWITGETSMVNRQAAVHAFANDPEVRVFIGNIQASGTGVDGLQKSASEVVFAEASWVPGENEQCVDRFHRIGQKNAVNATFFVVEGSLGERILRSSIRKAGTTKQALDASMELE